MDGLLKWKIILIQNSREVLVESKDSFVIQREVQKTCDNGWRDRMPILYTNRQNFDSKEEKHSRLASTICGKLISWTFRHWQKHNDSNRYLLTCIDVLSKYAWAVPLKNKSGHSFLEVFATINGEQKPNYLQTNKGSALLNAAFKRIFTILRNHIFNVE